MPTPSGLDQDQPRPTARTPTPGTRWPALAGVEVRFRGQFAYVDGRLPDGEVLPLCRLRYGGSASRWGFAIYRASHDDYEDTFLPSGATAGSPAGSPRLRLRPLPQRPHRLAARIHRRTNRQDH